VAQLRNRHDSFSALYNLDMKSESTHIQFSNSDPKRSTFHPHLRTVGSATFVERSGTHPGIKVAVQPIYERAEILSGSSKILPHREDVFNSAAI
jgi:hypothetical protein